MANAVLHGTWVAHSSPAPDDAFFVWAERTVHQLELSGPAQRVQRHPFAATTLEVSALLTRLVPQVDWSRSQRVTRVAFLPSGPGAPIPSGWPHAVAEGEVEEPLDLRPWRVEGIGISPEDALDLLIALPVMNHHTLAAHRLGADLLYWGAVAKFVLELLARQRFIPGLRSTEGGLRAAWLPVLEATGDEQRFNALAKAMPPAARSIMRERGTLRLDSVPASGLVLQAFIDRTIDAAVRAWGRAPSKSRQNGQGGDDPSDISAAWWHALWSKDGQIKVGSKQSSAQRFLHAWRNWTYRTQARTGASFRICFRLEPPSAQGDEPNAQDWTLRYFLQASDDPSLLVPAWEVWREQGDILSYLNRRFDNPQEKLLEGLGIAADLCPAIRRSLRSDSPESASLSASEAFQFLRETARLLEGSGFGVMVPPWWNRQDARLRLRARLSASADMASSGMLSMSSLVEYDWEMALGDESLSREEFERLAALKTPLVEVRGRWVLLQPDQVEAAIAFWEKHRDRSGLPLSEALNLALGARDELDGMPISDLALDETLTGLVESLGQPEQMTLVETPARFSGQLRPYQVRGLSWLAFLREKGFGACLADDMGLGKTIQAIALVLHDREKRPDLPPSLLICPTSLVGNWQREVARFAPGLRVLVHHGTGRAEGLAFEEQCAQSDLVISTYGLVRRDIEDLRRVHWAHVILDEAQNIKNPQTKQARAVRLLRAAGRIALTGTPVENHLSELWSIMSFLNPSYLGSQASFRRSFALPIERYQDEAASERLRRLVRPFVLRRVKTDPRVIQDLPEKFEQKIYCNLTREQATLYEATVRSALEAIQNTGGNGDIGRRGAVLAMLTRLKQICNHPALYLGDGSSTANRSGKLNRLCEMLEEILEQGERALVFTQYAEMGTLLHAHLQDAFGLEVFFLHGGTSAKQRDRMIQVFQEDADAPPIFVLSLKAGGTGLNLMRANHVFHYDRWWNPAVENQATDRAYRIGQTRDVQVRKFICLGTLEEKIDLLIESKRELAENVIGDGTEWLTELSTDDLRELVALREEAVETE